jgi:hypothetical protein
MLVGDKVLSSRAKLAGRRVTAKDMRGIGTMCKGWADLEHPKNQAGRTEHGESRAAFVACDGPPLGHHAQVFPDLQAITDMNAATALAAPSTLTAPQESDGL